MSVVAYNPNDPVQQAFLAALQSSEGTAQYGAGAYGIGFGGVNEAGLPTDAYGFPDFHTTFHGAPTSASGAYQFQSGTWHDIASKYGLNFANPEDQNAGAWYLAQQQFQANGGNDLYTSLQSGDTNNVAQKLSRTWTSLGQSNTFVSAYSNGYAQAQAGNDPLLNAGAASATGGSAGGSGGTGSGAGASSGGILSGIVGWIERSFLIVVAVAIIVVGLWWVLAEQGYVPSITDAAKGAAKAAELA